MSEPTYIAVKHIVDTWGADLKERLLNYLSSGLNQSKALEKKKRQEYTKEYEAYFEKLKKSPAKPRTTKLKHS